MADMLAGRLHMADRGSGRSACPSPSPRTARCASLVGPAGAPGAVPHDTLLSYLQQSLRGHYGSEPEHVAQLVALVRHGRLRLDASVSDVLPLADAPLAVKRLQSKQGSPIRLVLRPTGI